MRYLGPIDGHDLPLLISTLEFAKTCDHPIVIHVLTQKGKGFEAALKSSGKIPRPRTLRRADRRNARRPSPARRPMYQDVMGQTMVKLCQKNNTLVGITAAMPSGTGMKHLEKAMPDRYYRRRHRRGTRASSSPPAWRRWVFIRSWRFIPRSSNAPTTAFITTSACRICR